MDYNLPAQQNLLNQQTGIKGAQEQAIEQCPPLLPLPLPKSAKSLFDLLRQKTEEVALKHGVPADVLLRKRWLDALVLGYIDSFL